MVFGRENPKLPRLAPREPRAELGTGDAAFGDEEPRRRRNPGAPARQPPAPDVISAPPPTI